MSRGAGFTGRERERAGGRERGREGERERERERGRGGRETFTTLRTTFKLQN